MRTVQMTLDPELVDAVDEAAAELHVNRSAFTRTALRQALERHRLAALERQHRDGYATRPPAADEFAVWEDEQVWGDR